MNAKELKNILSEIPDDHEIEFVGDIDGELREVTFHMKPCAFNETATLHLTKRQEMTVEVQVILQLPFTADSRKDAINQAEDFELPSQYKEDSFEILNVYDEKGEVL